MVGNDQEGGEDVGSFAQVLLDGEVGGQHDLENQVVLVTDNVGDELAKTD